MLLHMQGKAAQVRDDRDLRAVGAERKGDWLFGVVRNVERANLNVADLELPAPLNVFDALDRGFLAGLFGIFGVHFHDFAVRRFGEVRGAIPLARHLREAA
jgi:hypothetical protein